MHFPCTKRAFFYNKVIIKQQNECNIYFTNSQQFTPIPSIFDPSMMGISHSFNMCPKNKEINILLKMNLCTSVNTCTVLFRFYSIKDFLNKHDLLLNGYTFRGTLQITFFLEWFCLWFKTRKIPSNFEIVKKVYWMLLYNDWLIFGFMSHQKYISR